MCGGATRRRGVEFRGRQTNRQNRERATKRNQRENKQAQGGARRNHHSFFFVVIVMCVCLQFLIDRIRPPSRATGLKEDAHAPLFSPLPPRVLRSCLFVCLFVCLFRPRRPRGLLFVASPFNPFGGHISVQLFCNNKQNTLRTTDEKKESCSVSLQKLGIS
jgi:hypothetical protein